MDQLAYLAVTLLIMAFLAMSLQVWQTKMQPDAPYDFGFVGIGFALFAALFAWWSG